MDHPNTDALDAFMSSLDSSTLDKTEIRKLKIELINLRKEEMQLLKLINIAKPANLPPLKPHVPLVTTKLKSDFKDLKSVVGHVKKTKCNQVSFNYFLFSLHKHTQHTCMCIHTHTNATST